MSPSRCCEEVAKVALMMPIQHVHANTLSGSTIPCKLSESSGSVGLTTIHSAFFRVRISARHGGLRSALPVI